MVRWDNRLPVLGRHEDNRVRATGKEYFTRWVHLYTLKDGLIVGFEEFADTAAIAAAFRQGDD